MEAIAIPLGKLAAKANAAHQAVEESKGKAGEWMSHALNHAMVAGEALCAAKAQMKHGEWLPWVEEQFEATPRHAQNYMRLWGKRDELAKAKRVSHLSLRDAVKLLAEVKSERSDPALGGAVSRGEDYDSDEWYTPIDHIEAARVVLGGIDLDPASCAYANQTIRAKTFYDKEADGLAHEWRGRVWLNPPYSQPLAAQFGAKLIEEYEAGRVIAAVMVQNASTDTGWFHDLAAKCWICLTRGRINFDREDGESAANRYGQAFFYLGPEPKRFVSIFKGLGLTGRLT